MKYYLRYLGSFFVYIKAESAADKNINIDILDVNYCIYLPINGKNLCYVVSFFISLSYLFQYDDIISYVVCLQKENGMIYSLFNEIFRKWK